MLVQLLVDAVHVRREALVLVYSQEYVFFDAQALGLHCREGFLQHPVALQQLAHVLIQVGDLSVALSHPPEQVLLLDLVEFGHLGDVGVELLLEHHDFVEEELLLLRLHPRYSAQALLLEALPLRHQLPPLLLQPPLFFPHLLHLPREEGVLLFLGSQLCLELAHPLSEGALALLCLGRGLLSLLLVLSLQLAVALAEDGEILAELAVFGSQLLNFPLH